MGTRWRGMLAPINKPTGDGRRMAKGALRSRPLPLALKWQRQDEGGHDTSVVIGLVDTLNIDEALGEVWAEGELFDDQPDLPRLTQDVAEAMLLTSKKVIGPSVDAGAADMVFVREGSDEPLTDADWEELLRQEMETGEPAPIEMLFVDYEIAAATLVPIPAFVEARPFQLLPSVEQSPEPALVASVTGATDLPIADRETTWDGSAATGRVFDKYTAADGTVDTAAVAKAFLYRDPDADPATKGAYKLGFADVIDGELRIVPAGVAACAGGRGVDAADIPAAEKDRIKTKICTLYGKIQGKFSDWPDCPVGSSSAARLAVLTAAAAGPVALPAEVFEPPLDPPPYQLLTVEEPRDGETFRRVAGYMAPFGTCHVGFRDVCVSAPEASIDYALFHRYPIQTGDGLVAAGRITTGLGELGSGCSHLTCRRNDDHACRQYSVIDTIAHHDQMRTVAHVRATEYAGVGIWVQGVIADDATEADLAVLARQRVSGDWRDYAGHLEMVELLALAREEPGFPAPQTVLRDGRQHSLIAAGAVPPVALLPHRAAGPGEIPALAGIASTIAALVVAELRGPNGVTSMLAADQPPAEPDCQPGEPGCEDMPMPAPVVHTGAMVALRMTDDDAARLAVDGGEPADELHTTLVYLGEAADINAASRQAIIDALTALAAEWHTAAEGALSIVGDAFSVNLFNPQAEDKEPCIVLGLSGEQIAAAHQQVTDVVKAVYGFPAQHSPFQPHITLAYTNDASLVAELADRTGDVTFDRLRIAFAGSNHDIPLGGGAAQPAEDDQQPGVAEEPVTAAALLADIDAALAAPDFDERARAAALLARQIEETAGV